MKIVKIIFLIILSLIASVIVKTAVKSDFARGLVQRYHEYLLRDIEKISVGDSSLGNTEGNINNYGLVAETENSLFYVKDVHIYKCDKDLKNEIVLVDQPVNEGKDTINVVEDWLFFRQGKKINRIKTDGANVETIFRGYSLDMQVVGNWIYLLSISDDMSVCRIDVNGQNKQVLSGKNVRDMAVYKDKIYYSYKSEDEGYFEAMNIDGSDKQFLSNIQTRNMIVDDEYIYYIDDVEEILYRMNINDKSIEKLSDNQIPKFLKDDNHIFYTLKDDSDWRFKGLYRMDANGSNATAIDSECYLTETGIGVTSDYIFYVSTDGKAYPSLKIINRRNIYWQFMYNKLSIKSA